ncbi:MAG: SufD family Fe-S cluster assembly protein [Porticoccaceae bacterium]
MSLLDTLLAAPLPEDALLPLRRAGQQRLRALGLPGARDEAWRYTPLRALQARRFDDGDRLAGGQDLAASLLERLAAAGPRLVFVNGEFRANLSDLARLPTGLTVSPGLPGSDPMPERSDRANAFVAANLALAGQGARIEVAAGARISQPLSVFWIDQACGRDGLGHARIEIALGAGSMLHLEERRLADPAGSPDAPLYNRVAEVAVAADAHFSHRLFSAAAERASVIAHSHYRLAERAAVEHFELCPGAALYRHALDVTLAGAGARFRSGGVQAPSARRHAEIAIDVQHQAEDSSCELVWRGLAEGRGRLAFGGRLVIAAGADGSDARLSNKNLLLSADAEIDTRPVLEIHADEVKAAHGATVGSLDETALFYLRSRGLPEPAARALLTRAFAFEALAVVEDATMRARIEAELPELLPGLAELG